MRFKFKISQVYKMGKEFCEVGTTKFCIPRLASFNKGHLVIDIIKFDAYGRVSEESFSNFASHNPDPEHYGYVKSSRLALVRALKKSKRDYNELLNDIIDRINR